MGVPYCGLAGSRSGSRSEVDEVVEAAPCGREKALCIIVVVRSAARSTGREERGRAQGGEQLGSCAQRRAASGREGGG